MPPYPPLMHITYRTGPVPRTVFCGRCHCLVDEQRTQDHTREHRETDKVLQKVA